MKEMLPVIEAMSVGAKSTESMKERETKFLCAREKKHTEPFATSEGNDVAGHSFSGLSKEGGNFGGEVNRGGSPNTNSLDRVGDSTVCSEALGIGAGNVYNISNCDVREELINEVRMIYKVLMNVKRRDFVRLSFNDLVHMIFAGKGGQMIRKEDVGTRYSYLCRYRPK